MDVVDFLDLDVRALLVGDGLSLIIGCNWMELLLLPQFLLLLLGPLLAKDLGGSCITLHHLIFVEVLMMQVDLLLAVDLDIVDIILIGLNYPGFMLMLLLRL